MTARQFFTPDHPIRTAARWDRLGITAVGGPVDQWLACISIYPTLWEPITEVPA